MNNLWQQMCEAAELDPQQRLAAREAVLGDEQALDCSLYRPDPNDPDAEEEDLGDGRVLFAGVFQPPADWSAADCEDFYDGDPAEQFLAARIECVAEPGSSAFCIVEAGDYVAVTRGAEVSMYFVCLADEDDDGLHCVLVKDDPEF